MTGRWERNRAMVELSRLQGWMAGWEDCYRSGYDRSTQHEHRQRLDALASHVLLQVSGQHELCACPWCGTALGVETQGGRCVCTACGAVGPLPSSLPGMMETPEDAWNDRREPEQPDPAVAGETSETMADKTLDVTDMEELAKKVSDVVVHGNPGAWVCVGKASSESQGWMKSTKVMAVGSTASPASRGCLVQVTTQQRNPDGSWALAEALTFVPHARLDWFVKKE